MNLDDEKIDFTKEGCDKIGEQILLFAYSAKELSPYYLRYMKAYFRDALKVLDDEENKNNDRT